MFWTTKFYIQAEKMYFSESGDGNKRSAQIYEYAKVPKVRQAYSKRAPRLAVAQPKRKTTCSPLLTGLLTQ